VAFFTFSAIKRMLATSRNKSMATDVIMLSNALVREALGIPSTGKHMASIFALVKTLNESEHDNEHL
jgi:hypothetical protein